MRKLETEINRYERNYKDGGKIKEVGFENSNLYLYGFGKDSNGNSIVKIGFPNQRAFSIQTNGVLKFTHDKRGYSLNELTKNDIEKIEKEVVEYVKEYGSKEQKSKLKTYSKFADGGSVGEIEAKIADFRRRAENKNLPESAKNKFLSMAEELEKTLPKAEKKGEAKAEKPKFKVGDVVVFKEGDALRKKITSIKENKKGEIIYSGYYESKPSEKFSYDGTELVIFKRPKKEPKKEKKATEKVLGIEYTVGTKAHKKALENLKHIKDLEKSETSMPKEKEKSKKAEKAEEKDEYNCDTLIKEAKERKAKAKERAKERAKEPKKTPATKNKEAVEKTTERVAANVEKRAEKGNVTASEIEKLIKEYEDAIKKLKDVLSGINNGKKFQWGGTAESSSDEAPMIGGTMESSLEYAKGGGIKKVGKVMHEFKAGTLHSGKSGKIVKNLKQAIAIALSEAGLSKN